MKNWNCISRFYCKFKKINLKVQFIFFISAMLLIPVAHSEEVKNLTWDLSPSEVTSISINGYAAEVNFIYKPTIKTRVQLSGNGILTREGKDYFLKLDVPESKTGWLELLKNSSFVQTARIDIIGQSLPLFIVLRQGEVSGAGWQKPISVNILDGKLTLKNVISNISAYVYKGTTVFENISGQVQYGSYNSSLTIKNMTGEQSYNVFQGQIVGNDIKGRLQFQTAFANVKLTDGSGNLQIDNQKGIFSISKFSGQIEGESEDGSLNIAAVEANDISFKTKSSNINVRLPQQSGSYLSLITNEGEIVVPKEIKVWRSSMQKAATGRLKGDKHQGRVWVRSQEGNIIVK